MEIKNNDICPEENIRDFSYIVNKDGYKIKDNSFIRANNINNLKEEEFIKLIDKYKIKTVIDLRNKDEIKDEPYKYKNITKYYSLPLLKGKREGVTKEKDLKHVKVNKVPNIYQIYMEMITSKTSKKQIKKVFKIIMNQKNSSILFHCTFGKDRTGIISLILLSMLDVDINTIKEDYLYTNEYSNILSKKMYDYYYEKSKSEEYSKQMSELYLAKEEYIDYIIDYMQRKRNTINEYIEKEIGISRKQIDKFKKEFLVK